MLEKFSDVGNSLDKNCMYNHSRTLFHIPKHQNDNCIYFCGNSLGLQPKSVRSFVEQELSDWETLGVEGHFRGKNPWFGYHHLLAQPAANLVGALPHEVVVMNSLTVNLHLLMVSFYRPTPQRYKIIIEAGAFPSDLYAVQTQAQFHGFDPADAIIELKPREGEFCLQNDDILEQINKHANSVALVMLGGVNYYTGQFYNLPSITKAAHAVGAIAGFDLAHATGNVPLKLHDWDIDFAVWCSYKYLNSGPGGTSGVFVHERHAASTTLNRFGGWWGNSEETRFTMPHKFVPQYGASGWQLSNAQILPMAVHRASLQIFDEIGMDNLREKSEKMSAYLFRLLDSINPNQKYFTIITPRNPQERGCQTATRGEAVNADSLWFVARACAHDHRCLVLLSPNKQRAAACRRVKL